MIVVMPLNQRGRSGPIRLRQLKPDVNLAVVRGAVSMAPVDRDALTDLPCDGIKRV